MKASAASSTATPRPASPATCGSRPADRFRLTGPSQRPDPRVNAWRKDIADVALAGTLFAPHYAAAVPCALGAAAAMLREAPSAEARAVSQLVHGEGFQVLEVARGWAWGRCAYDDYVGYLPAEALAAPSAQPTHCVTAALAPVFATPDIKAPVVANWPIGARFIGLADGDFLAIEAGFVHRRHAAPLDAAAADPVAVALRLIGQPYLWGGRGAGGIDCSGLVQVALGLAGIAAPRDSDMQRDGVGDPLAEGDALRRGDLIFFPGHVGLMVDGTDMIHANAYWMAVTVEPLADVVARLAPDHPQPILARRRPA